MDVREKLVELLGANTCKCDCCEDCEYCKDEDDCIVYLKNSMADHLIANGVTVQEWISVKDRLPEPFRGVIVCRPGLDEPVVEQGRRDVNGWWKVYGTRTKAVTHWMPLPKALREGEDE